ncbi:hypothetical protein JOJ86_005924 [Rhodococcus percolatus]|uniref:hypothetical protein n=1 Tax=Rhodococcus opacus TaxID=37919 RepID=UPI001AE4E7B4|nr:hypothetical protein [Rhodococcus opacus]MBP2208198.1 hypothetical protein [Rhodococcus opacus]
MANYLRLFYPANPSGNTLTNSLTHRLPVGSNPEAVRQQLRDADPNEVVEVQIVLMDQLHEQTLYLRTSSWSAWMIHDADEPDSPPR